MSIIKGLILTLAAVFVVACGPEKNQPIASKTKGTADTENSARQKTLSDEFVDSTGYNFEEGVTPSLEIRTICSGEDGKMKFKAVVSELTLNSLFGDVDHETGNRNPLTTVLGIQREGLGSHLHSKAPAKREQTKSEISISTYDTTLTIDLRSLTNTDSGVEATAKLERNELGVRAFSTQVTCKTKQSF